MRLWSTPEILVQAKQISHYGSLPQNNFQNTQLCAYGYQLQCMQTPVLYHWSW